QLARDEPDGHDAVLLGRVQQALARELASRLVLEVDLGEPGQRIPHVRPVVDGQPPPAASIHVGERPIRKARPLAALEASHGANDSLPFPAARESEPALAVPPGRRYRAVGCIAGAAEPEGSAIERSSAMRSGVIHLINPKTDSLTTRPQYLNRAL